MKGYPGAGCAGSISTKPLFLKLVEGRESTVYVARRSAAQKNCPEWIGILAIVDSALARGKRPPVRMKHQFRFVGNVTHRLYGMTCTSCGVPICAFFHITSSF